MTVEEYTNSINILKDTEEGRNFILLSQNSLMPYITDELLSNIQKIYESKMTDEQWNDFFFKKPSIQDM